MDGACVRMLEQFSVVASGRDPPMQRPVPICLQARGSGVAVHLLGGDWHLEEGGSRSREVSRRHH